MGPLIKAAGICSYIIWPDGDELFVDYDCGNVLAFAERTQADRTIVDKRDVYMGDVLALNPVTGARTKMTGMFLMA